MKRLFTLVAAATMLGLAVPSWGDTFQFQGQSLSGTGSFSFDTTTNTLTVSNALIDQLNTAFDNLVGPCQSPAGCAITGGALNLNLAGATYNSGTGVYTFGSGGGLTVDGTISDPGLNTSGSLLTASFLSGATLQCAGGTCDFGGTLDAATILLDPNINVNGQTPVDGSALQTLQINIQGGQGYSGSVTEANVLVDTTDPPPQTAPEPASLALLGFGFAGMAGTLRKKSVG